MLLFETGTPIATATAVASGTPSGNGAFLGMRFGEAWGISTWLAESPPLLPSKAGWGLVGASLAEVSTATALSSATLIRGSAGGSCGGGAAEAVAAAILGSTGADILQRPDERRSLCGRRLNIIFKGTRERRGGERGLRSAEQSVERV
jgi:hypothetical protein